MKAGMNVARMNFSHGTQEYHAGTIQNIREAVKIISKEYELDEHPIAIALDTKGPEIRTGLLEGGPTAEVELVKGKKITITTSEEYATKCSSDIVYVDYKNITKVISSGSKIFIDDGLISLLAKEVGK